MRRAARRLLYRPSEKVFLHFSDGLSDLTPWRTIRRVWRSHACGSDC
ncbi:hypothetical protein HMPREF9123_1217 [Neisseria bacilliformis ATCC BAA-1200]|uniref:Uncharacterized protein n=1 Tax=Neisseria bacilliformis ATCC BAA-1200 TaxID=888742 RepID=F2BBW2_9NEIS|nr:hypothetical protein HMPREF9123_1217 [Neisseria bacilliformis ATCC BAA-1200]